MLELVTVILLIGLASVAAISRIGHATLQNTTAQGYAHRLALDLRQARQRTIATGDNHYISMSETSGAVTSYTMYRRAAGGDVVVEQTTATPTGVTVATSHTTLEFDFDGAALGPYAVVITGPQRSWSVAAVQLTGAVTTVETTP